MKISLIFTINELNENFSELHFRDESIGFIPPLSLMTVAALFEKEDAQVQLIDMAAEGLDYEGTLKRLSEFSPDVLGFTLSTSSLHPILSWIRKFKEGTGLPVIVGGAHAELYPEETMAHREIDFIVLGEAEPIIPKFVKAFDGKQNYGEIESFGYRKDGRTVINRKSSELPRDLDALPLPARHLIRNELYFNILTRKRNFTAMLSARGCPYRCSFCNQNLAPYRRRSAGNFVAEIKANYEKFGIQEFDIYDSTFTADKKRVLEVCRLIATEGLPVSWTVRSRVDSVNEEMLRELKNAGCHTIMYGIESSSQEILKRMNKGISTDRIRHIINHTKEVGIETLGFFLVGYPGETVQTIKDTIRFSLELPLDYAQYTVLVPFSNTEIYDYYLKNGMPDHWKEYTLNPAVGGKMELIGTEINREQAGRYVAEAYRKFYFRPKIIWKRAKNIKSAGEFGRLTIGALNLMKSVMSFNKTV